MKNIIKRIEVRLNEFVLKHQDIKSKNIILEQENDKLVVELKKKRDEIIGLKEKIKIMSISKSVDSSIEDVKSTRLKINEYVREIDKCIASLSK